MTNHDTTQHDFQQVIHDFHQAITDILDPQDITDLHGNHGTTPSLLDQIITGMSQQSGTTMPVGTFDSRPPIWISGLDWLIDVTRTITTAARETHRAKHHAPADDATAWLTWALDAPWGPAHTQTLRHATTRLHNAKWAAMRLIWPELFTITGPCPHCGTATTQQPDTLGSHITRPTLTVHALWADCAHCGTTWEGADILTLANTLQHATGEGEGGE